MHPTLAKSTEALLTLISSPIKMSPESFGVHVPGIRVNDPRPLMDGTIYCLICKARRAPIIPSLWSDFNNRKL